MYDVSAPAAPPVGVCALCGEPMPPGEEMFKYHGYSGPCPKAAPVAEPEYSLMADLKAKLTEPVAEPFEGAPMCGKPGARLYCRLPRGHAGPHASHDAVIPRGIPRSRVEAGLKESWVRVQEGTDADPSDVDRFLRRALLGGDQ